MNNIERKKIKTRILTEIESLKKRIPQLTNDTQPISPENSIGRVSRMDAINNKSVLENALNTAKKRLEKLLFIQKEIEKKEFGICVRCKKNIPIARLIIIPESRKCVNCSG